MDHRFSYLTNSIRDANLYSEPFTHLYLERFFVEEDLERLITDEQIVVAECKTTEALIEALCGQSWVVQEFPGCTTSISEYLNCLATDDWPVDKGLLEGFGMTLRLQQHRDPIVRELITFLNSGEFHVAMEAKFGIVRPNRIETSIQKYLAGYEISPHPDIRSKAVTYLSNINTSQAASELDIHTHLLRFRPEYRFICEFWKYNRQWDTTWVPWSWCDTLKTIGVNNTLIAFKPSYDTLHGVKLRYDHLKFQQTQIYGNLWYTDVPFMLPRVPYTEFICAPE